LAVVDVWVADLDVPAAIERALAAELDDAERARAERFRFPHLERRFVVSHAMLRRLLRLHTDAPLDFVVGPHGKPALASGDGPHFNLSHSGERALVAISADHPVGVDVELIRPLQRQDAVAERIMSPAELDRYQRAAEADRLHALLDVWTRKEAVLKASGEGITAALRGIDVEASGCQVQRLDAGTGYLAAVAAYEHGWTAATHRWEPEQPEHEQPE
jgi:4'-phosphopantetheinyl transferase